MKEKLFLLSLICCFPILSYCNDKPQELAINCIKYMLEKEYDKVIGNAYIPDSISGNKELTEKFNRSRIEYIKTKREEDVDYFRIEENGGVDKIVIEENEQGEEIKYVNEEKTKVNINVTIICKNGHKQTGGVSLILHNNKWKLYLQ